MGSPFIDNAPDNRPIVLLTVGASGRGHPATGPVSSLNELIDQLSPDYHFKVIAHPQTFGCCGDEVGVWLSRNGIDYYWHLGGWLNIRRILQKTSYDILMLNSFFDKEFSIPILLMRKIRLLPKTPMILSPRGEFSAGALSLKSLKKKFYMHFSRLTGLLRGGWLHATVTHESENAKALNLGARGVLMAPNPRNLFPLPEQPPIVLGGVLRLVFLGRLAKVKNLHFAIEVLSQVKMPIVFHIYGLNSEPEYWEACQEKISNLPHHIEVTYKGTLDKLDVPDILAQYDLFFLPTLGENFGHAIHESLSSGVPVLISDQTPWLNLDEMGVGWSLPLENTERFSTAINHFARLDLNERECIRINARKFAEQRHRESDSVRLHDEMFRMVLEEAGHPH